MIKLNSSKNEILDYVTRLWKAGISHPMNVLLRENIIKGRGFYNGGVEQMDPADLKTLKENGEVPIIVNVLAGFVDTMCGVENQSRYRNIVRIDDDTEEARRISEALTRFYMIFQEQEDVSYQDALKFKDMLVSGVGFSGINFEQGRFVYKRIEPMEMILDMNDVSPQFTESKFIGRIHFMTPTEIKREFNKRVDGVDVENYDVPTQFYGAALLNLTQTNVSTATSNAGFNTQQKLVSELQYKISDYAYSGTTKNGRYFETFDIEKAEEIAIKKSQIEEFASHRILRTFFMGDVLLSHELLTPCYPGQTDFSYVPLVWKRKNNGVPYSFTEPGWGVQQQINASFTKATNSINSNKVFITTKMGSSLPVVQDDPYGTDGLVTAADALRKRIFSKNSVTVFDEGTTIDFRDGIQLGEENFRIVETGIEMLKRIFGIYDDMRGGNSSNTSGIAEKIRIENSIRTNSFIFDHFYMMKKRVGLLVVKLLQHTAPNQYYLRGDGKENQAIVLNQLIEKINGETQIVNDISFLPFNMFLEEVPNFRSSLTQRREELLGMLNNPHANVLLMTPEFLDLFMDNGKQVAQGFKNTQQELAQIQNKSQTQNNPEEQQQQRSIPNGSRAGQ